MASSDVVDFVRVRSIDEYWDMIVTGLSKKLSRDDIRKSAIDAIDEEFNGQAHMLLHWPKDTDIQAAPHTDENERKIQNLAKQTFKKWCRICDKCNKYVETKDILYYNDFKLA